MAINEIDRLRALANFAEQVCSLAENGEEARRRINQMISRAEEDIRTKSLEIQMQHSHIALLKQLDRFMAPPPAAEKQNHIQLNSGGNGVSRVIGAEG